MENLLQYFQEGCKPFSSQRIGLELETLLFHRNPLKRMTYEGSPGLRNVLVSFVEKGWSAIYENGVLLGAQKLGATLTLEPGGQFEYSGAPHATLQDVFLDLNAYLEELKRICATFDLFPLSLGMDPISRDVSFIPKQRYHSMATYWKETHPISLDMMLKTASIQVNFDYQSEEDMRIKINTIATLQPFVSALFAHSPLKERIYSGFESYRNHIWTQMEPNRTGTPSFMREPSFGFSTYADYLLDIPLFFITHEGVFQEANGATFRSYYAPNNTLSAIPKEAWIYHISTAFPDVRLKQFIEIRGVDALPYPEIMAPAALWTGLLYAPDVLEKAHKLASTITSDEWNELSQITPRRGMETLWRGEPLYKPIQRLLDLAIEGLTFRHETEKFPRNEAIFLVPTQKRLLQKNYQNRSLSRNLLSHWETLTGGKEQDSFLESFPGISLFP